MEFLPAKTLISKNKFPEKWFGVDYNLNLYRGCSHGCIYCDSRSSCYQIKNFDIVKSKENVHQLFRKEIKKIGSRNIIGFGAMSDTYNPMEEKYEITRKALNILSNYDCGLSIETKSNLITRDIDLLKDINHDNNVIIKFSITTTDDKLASIIEPGAPSPSKRLKAMKKVSNAGIYTGVLLQPVLPYITSSEDNILTVIKESFQNNAKFISSYMGMTLRERDYYFNQLDKNFLNLKQKYINKYHNNYSCPAENYKELCKLFISNCEKYNLSYKMKDIISDYKIVNKIEYKQSTLNNF
ncbi:MAG: radical SAM protein [Methanobacteriaceae archaeon]|nr:radical SAM protein [Methanobacteriaceae archaeon]